MSASVEPSSARRASGISNEIDLICDRFEEEWQAGHRPCVEQFLSETAEPNRTLLLQELLALELDYRRRLGEDPSLNEYQARFPEYIGLVERVLSSLDATKSMGRGHADEREIAAHVPVEQIELVSPVGSGAFGVVWRAYDTRLQREVAVKLPRKRELSLRETRRFLQEAQAAAQLKHQHIVAIHAVGDRLQPYIVSDFIEGGTLREKLRQALPEPRVSALLCAKLAEALEHAHTHGVIHRDLKPGNILLDAQGEPHITDFGLAKLVARDASVTVEGELLGTPAYMSPEQAAGRTNEVEARSDVFSLGAILYEMLTGQRPFPGDREAVLHHIGTLDPVRPRKLVPSVPAELEAICLKALEKEPSQRYQTAGQFADDLRRFLEGRSTRARPLGRLQRAGRWCRRNRLLAAVSGAAAAATAALIAIAWSLSAGPPVASPLRRVTLETVPAGAHVVFVPLDDVTWEPQPHRMINAPKTSPVELDLLPGNYLVVAYLDEQRFHEVYRHVPEEPKALTGARSHLRWSLLEDGRIRLPRILIPPVTVVDGMVFLEGSDRFEMGTARIETLPPHTRRVPSFYVDPAEVTVAGFLTPRWFDPPTLRRVLPPHMRHHVSDPLPTDPVTYVAFDQVVEEAESMGKRLPEEAEYEYAATGGGRSAYPWGDSPEPLTAYLSLAPSAEAAAFDRTQTDPPILGLCTGPAEWTMSRFTLYPDLADRLSRLKPGVRLDLAESQKRIVRGSALSLSGNAETSDDGRYLPRRRIALIPQTWKAGLGFRCVRSAKPRLRPEDFVAVVVDSSALER